MMGSLLVKCCRLSRKGRWLDVLICAALIVLVLTVVYIPLDHDKTIKDQDYPQVLEPGPDPNAPKKVVLVTYTRSGSSLLGEAFNRNNESMYWFEPLYGLYIDMYGAHATSHGIQGDRKVPEYEEDAVIQTVLDMYSCNLKQLSPSVLFNRLQHILRNLMPRVANKFTQCLWKRNINQTWSEPTSCAADHLNNMCPKEGFSLPCYKKLHEPHFWDGSAATGKKEKQYVLCMASAKRQIHGCLHHLQERCEEVKVHSAKLTRLRMPSVQKLLSIDPWMKVIYLVRDPRGILNSRHRAAKQLEKAMLDDSNVLCPTMLRDLQAIDSIASSNPSAVLTLKYEDMVFEPLKALDSMYRHLSLETPVSVSSWFNSSMATGSTKSGGSTTQKKDPKGIALKWQSTMNKNTMDKINQNCAQVIQHLGYNTE